jgi:hypothetical protein
MKQLTALALASFLLACSSGDGGAPSPAAPAPKPAPAAGVPALTGCYELEPGDDNFNFMKFDPQDHLFYLDTMMGKPVEKPFTRAGDQLTIKWVDGPDQILTITSIDQAGISFTAGKPWKRIDCQRFDDHIRK